MHLMAIECRQHLEKLIISQGPAAVFCLDKICTGYYKAEKRLCLYSFEMNKMFLPVQPVKFQENDNIEIMV